MAGVLSAADLGIPKALLEVGRRPLIVEVLEALESFADPSEIRVVTGEGGAKLRRFLRGYYRGDAIGAKLRFFRQRRPLGPLPACLAARVKRGRILIWLCDTLVSGRRPFLAADTLYTAPVAGDLGRWCLARRGRGGRLAALVDKPRKPLSDRPEALIGVYSLSDAAVFRRAGLSAVRSGVRERGEYQLSAALRAYDRVRPLALRSAVGWEDAGDPRSFLAAKQRRLERLDGHRVELDEAFVVKTADAGSEKSLADERGWYRAAAGANPRLRGSMPAGARLVGGSLVLPYRDWPTLTDWFLYRSYYLAERSEEVFRNFLSFTARRLHRRLTSTPQQRRRLNMSMLVEKTEERLARFGAASLRRPLSLGGRRLASWFDLRREFRGLASELAEGTDEDWRMIHGDLVFSNVLANGSGGFFLVDPRGSYGGEPGPAGDRYYDFAKVSQCVSSRFDSIKKGEFRLNSRGGGSFSLEFPRSSDRGRLRWERSFAGFCRREGLDMRRLRLFESALLLSLLPLHRAHCEQSTALLLLGLQRLRDLLRP